MPVAVVLVHTLKGDLMPHIYLGIVGGDKGRVSKERGTTMACPRKDKVLCAPCATRSWSLQQRQDVSCMIELFSVLSNPTSLSVGTRVDFSA